MTYLSAIDILYVIFIAGSLAFGLEAMLLGFGGRLMVLYRRRRGKTLAIAFMVGLAIVVPAVATSAALMLEPLYFCVLVLVYMFVASGIINMFGPARVQTSHPPLPPQPSEGEIEAMVVKRGLGKLVKKKRAKK